MTGTWKAGIDPSVSFQTFKKCLKRLYMINFFFIDILSKHQCGFRKGFSAQHCLIAMIEKWKKSVDSKWTFGTLLTDLSKAFDYILYELLIAKLSTYGFDFKALKCYVINRKQS